MALFHRATITPTKTKDPIADWAPTHPGVLPVTFRST